MSFESDRKAYQKRREEERKANLTNVRGVTAYNPTEPFYRDRQLWEDRQKLSGMNTYTSRQNTSSKLPEPQAPLYTPKNTSTMPIVPSTSKGFTDPINNVPMNTYTGMQGMSVPLAANRAKVEKDNSVISKMQAMNDQFNKERANRSGTDKAIEFITGVDTNMLKGAAKGAAAQALKLGMLGASFGKMQTPDVVEQRRNASKAVDMLLGPKPTDPMLSKAGNVVGSTAVDMLAMGPAMGAGETVAAKAAQAGAKGILPRVAGGAATGAIIGGTHASMNGADTEELAKEIGRNALFFGAGSAASEVAGKAMDEFLINRGLQNSVPLYIGEQVGKGLAFSAAGTAATYPTYGKDEKPTAEQIGSQFLMGMAMDAYRGIAAIPGMKAQSKAILEQSSNTLKKSLGTISELERYGNSNPEFMNNMYETAKTEIAKTKYELSTNRLLGHETDVQHYNQILDAMYTELGKRQSIYNAARTTGITGSEMPQQQPINYRTPIGYTPNSTQGIETTSKPIKNIEGTETMQLGTKEGYQRIGRPYAKVDNDTIYQGQNTVGLIPGEIITQNKPQEAVTNQVKNSEAVKLEPTQAKIEANKGTQENDRPLLANVGLGSIDGKMLGNIEREELNKALENMDDGYYRLKLNGVDELQTVEVQTHDNTRTFTILRGERADKHSNSPIIDVNKQAEKINTEDYKYTVVTGTGRFNNILRNKAITTQLDSTQLEAGKYYKVQDTHGEKYIQVWDVSENGKAKIKLVHLNQKEENYAKEHAIDLTNNMPVNEKITDTNTITQQEAKKAPGTIEEWKATKEVNMDKKRIESAYRGVSFDPDRRAASDIQSVNRIIDSVADEVSTLEIAKRYPNETIEQLEAFKNGLVTKYNALISATSRTLSPAITGPARFNYARNEKAMATEHKRREEYIRYYENAVKVIKRNLERNIPLSEKKEAAKEIVLKDTRSTLATIKDIDMGNIVGSKYLFKANLTGRLATQAKHGNVEAVKASLEEIKSFQEKEGIKVFAANNKIWKLAERASENSAAKEAIKKESPKAVAGIEIRHNAEKGGIEIVFDEKPSSEITQSLSKNGFRYSSRQKLWYAKTTPMKEKFANSLLDKYRTESEQLEKNVSVVNEGIKSIETQDTKQEVQEVKTPREEATVKSNSDSTRYMEIDGKYEPVTVEYMDDFGAYYEVKDSQGNIHNVSSENILTEEEYLKQKGNDILADQKNQIESKKIMAQQAVDVVNFLKAQKTGKRPMKIYLSPELAGVDEIGVIGQYLSFTDDPAAYKLDTLETDLSYSFPEVKDMGLEEFGTWLVDKVKAFREDKKIIAEAEMTHKECMEMLNINGKTMQSVEGLKNAISEIEKKKNLIPLDLQFFAEQRIKEYKSLLRQLQYEGVNQSTINRVIDLQKKFKQAEKEIAQLKARNEKQLDNLIQKQKKQLETMKARNEAKIASIKEKNVEKIASIKEKNAIKVDKIKEKSKARVDKIIKENKIKNTLSQFDRMTDENIKEIESKYKEIKKVQQNKKWKNFHLEPQAQAAVNELVSFLEGKSIDARSTIELTQLQKALYELEAYESDTGISKSLQRSIENIAGARVSDLTYDEFMDVYNAVMVTAHQNRFKNRFITSERHNSVHEAAEETKRLAQKKLKANRGIKVNSNGSIDIVDPMLDKLNLPLLTAKTLCAKIEGTQGGPLTEILYTNIVKGHTKKYTYMMKSINQLQESMKNIDLKKLDESTYTLHTEEGNTQIPSSMKIAIALNSYNEFNRHSLLHGGICKKNSTEVLHITEESLLKLQKELTPEERAFVEATLNFYATLNKDEMNSVSMELWNYEIANQKFYYPKITPHFAIHSKDPNVTNGTQLNKINAGSLEEAGFFKEKRKTNTPILLEHPLKVIMNSIIEMSDVTGYAAALRDSKMLLRELKPFIEQNYSKTMYNQLSDYILAMNRPSNVKAENDTILEKFYNNTVNAIFGLNLSTSLKQPLGLVNAAVEIEPRYIMKALKKLPGTIKKEEIDRIYQYAPYLWYRAQGHINREMSETNMKESVERTFYGKKPIRSYMTQHITSTDMFVAYRLWYAAEEKIKATTNLTPGTEAFYKAVGELATEITLSSQSSGEITHRSQVLRTENLWKKAITAFQGQAQVCYNQFVYETERFKETHNAYKYMRALMLIVGIPAFGSIVMGDIAKTLQGNKNSLIVKAKQAQELGLGMDEVMMEFLDKYTAEVLSNNLYSGVAYDAIQSARRAYGSNTNNPLFRELNKIAEGMEKVRKKKLDDGAVEIGKSLASLSGLPIDNIIKNKDMIKNIFTGFSEFDVTPEVAFDAYRKKVNQLKSKADKEEIKLTGKQQQAIKDLNKIKREINEIKEDIEDNGSTESKQAKLDRMYQIYIDTFKKYQSILMD